MVGVPESKFVPVCTDASVGLRSVALSQSACARTLHQFALWLLRSPRGRVEWHARCAALVALCGLVPAPVGLKVSQRCRPDQGRPRRMGPHASRAVSIFKFCAYGEIPPVCAARTIFFCLGSCGGFRCLHHPSGALRGRLLKLVTRTCRQHNVHVMAVVSFADAHVYAGCSEACASAAFNWRSVAMLRCNASTTGSGKATAPGTSLAQEMNKAATALLECVTAQLNPDAGCADMQALLEAMSSQPTLPRFIAGVGWEPTRGCLVKLCQGNCPFGVFHKALATDGATTACANKIDGRPPGAGCGHVHSNGTAAVSPMSTFM